MSSAMRKSSSAGFTLPEVVVASALLMIAMVPILRALTHVNFNSVILSRKTQSLCFAQGRLNRIKAESIYNFDNNFGQNNISLSNSYLANISQTSVSSDLKVIGVSVGQDHNGNGLLDSTETDVILQTKIARRY